MGDDYLQWLTWIPGVSPEAALLIRAAYPSVVDLQVASPDELAEIAGLNPDVAERILRVARSVDAREDRWYREKPSLFLCPECGKFIGRDATSCPHCAVAFGEDDVEALREAEELLLDVSGDVRICTHCGAFMDRGMTSCPSCDRTYEPDEMLELPATGPVAEPEAGTCASCGAYVPSDAGTCAICGEAVAPPEPAAEPPVPVRSGVIRGFLDRWQNIVETPSTSIEVTPEDELGEVERLLDADPTAGRLWVRQAELLQVLGRPREAISAYERAADLDREREDEYRRAALRIVESHKDSTLSSRWTPPLAAAPADPQVTAARRALLFYDHLLQVQPSLRVAWETKAELHRRIGQDSEAEACLREAERLGRDAIQAELAGLQGLRTSGVAVGGRHGVEELGRTNGRVNGLTNGRGSTNGLTNGLRGRTNGLTNGLRGRTNGLTNGLRGRTNGLVNGLRGVRLRGGRVNGLVNGNGLTNGRIGRYATVWRASPFERSRSLVGIAAAIALMVLIPVVGSLMTGHVPGPEGFAVDGAFGDWADVPDLADSPSDQTTNRDVNLLSYKVAATEDSVFVYARFEGLAFAGSGLGGVDTLFAFVDEDGRASTGYPIDNLGADALVEVSGWDGVVRDVHKYRFGVGDSPHDWNRFRAEDTAQARAAGSEVELAFPSDVPATSRILLVSADRFGSRDFADAIAVPSRRSLVASQWTIAPPVVVGTRTPFLRIDVSARGGPVLLERLDLAKVGTVPDSAVSLDLYVDSGNGVFDMLDARVSSAPVLSGASTLTVGRTVADDMRLFVEASLGGAPANTTLGLSLEFVAADAAVTRRNAGLTLVYLGSTPGVTVDGAFGDWLTVPRYPDVSGDVSNRSGGSVINANVDLSAAAVDWNANLSFLLTVDGRMLGGTDLLKLRARPPIPTGLDSDLDTVPDDLEFLLDPDLRFDFDNDNITDANELGDVDGDGATDYPAGPDMWLNTTIPAWYPPPYANRSVSRYIGPILPTVEEGIDTAFVYLDADNSSATGLPVFSGPEVFGMDWVLAVSGRGGVVGSAGLYRYTPGAGTPWTFAGPAEAAVDVRNLEVSVDAALLNLSLEFRHLYVMADWQLSRDTLLPGPSLRGGGPEAMAPDGSDIVINEVNDKPSGDSTELQWVELANPTSQSKSLSGWALAVRKGQIVILVYVFSTETIGPWGSGTEYLAVDILPKELPKGKNELLLIDPYGVTVDSVVYSSGNPSNTYARFKDAVTGMPVDTDAGGDWYISTAPTRGQPNDRHRPTIAAGKTANRVTAAPGDAITYTVTYNNVDTGYARHVWVNDTLPAATTYVMSSAPYESVAGSTYTWHFTDVAPGPHSFTVTVLVGPVADGTNLVNTAVLDYVDQLRRPLERSQAWANVTVSRPVIAVAKVADRTDALPGDPIVYTIYYNNTGSANAANVWINDTLSPDVTFVTSSVPPSGSSGSTYRWYFTDVAPGPHSFTLTVQVNPTANSTIVNWVFLNYTSQNGAPLEGSSASTTVSIPEFQDALVVLGVPLVLIVIRRRRRTASGDGRAAGE